MIRTTTVTKTVTRSRSQSHSSGASEGENRNDESQFDDLLGGLATDTMTTTSGTVSWLLSVRFPVYRIVATVEPLLYDHPQNHIGLIRGMVAREGFVYEQKPLSVTQNVVV